MSCTGPKPGLFINHLLRERKLAAELRQASRFDPQRISIRLRSKRSPSLPSNQLASTRRPTRSVGARVYE